MPATVCVTGASGFLATHVVRAFIADDFIVRGTVRSLTNSDTLAPLREAVAEFPPASLQLFEADLTEPSGSGFADALRGCEVLVHTATPVIVDTDGLDDEAAMRAFADPAVAGTLALLRAALDAGVKHCVLTASTGCMLGRPEFDEPRAPSVMSAQVSGDIEWMIEHKQWYRLAKTQQEVAAREFAAAHGMGISTLHPSLILGPYFGGTGTRLSVGHELVLRWLTDAETVVPNGHTGVVDVREVAVSERKCLPPT
jgi:nucleoside-diphosphate-sugar epimerase